MVSSPHHMRPSLSHVAALLALGAALTAFPGVSVSRGRDASGRSTLRGSYRLDASEAILHLAESWASDDAVTADNGLATDRRPDSGHSPALTSESVLRVAVARSPIASARAAGGPPGVRRYLRPPGRASPLA